MGVFKLYSPSHFLHHANPFEDYISHWVIGAALESNLMVELLPFFFFCCYLLLFLFVFCYWLLLLRVFLSSQVGCFTLVYSLS